MLRQNSKIALHDLSSVAVVRFLLNKYLRSLLIIMCNTGKDDRHGVNGDVVNFPKIVFIHLLYLWR